MKFAFLQLLSILAVTAAVLALGSSLAPRWWGPIAASTMWPAAFICLAGALVAMVPLVWVALTLPRQIAMAALAGTAIRLLVTIVAAFIYQMSANVHTPSFTFWLMALYLPLLAVETVAAVILVQQTFGNGRGSPRDRSRNRPSHNDPNDTHSALAAHHPAVRCPCSAG